MTPKSYITLCIAAIIYVVMAAVAIVSPHGSSYALFSGSDTATASEQVEEIIDPATLAHVTFRNEAGVEVEIGLDELNTFAAVPVTVEIDGTQKTFTAAHFKTLMDWSCLKAHSDMIVIKGDNNTISACRTVDLQKDDNAYLIYADENGNPLDKESYGDYCLYVAEGSKHGFFTHVSIIDFG